MAVKLQLRRGLALDWTNANPLLAEGELALEIDTSKFKIGNGIDYWVDLDYASGTAGADGATGPQGPSGNSFLNAWNSGPSAPAYNVGDIVRVSGLGVFAAIQEMPAHPGGYVPLDQVPQVPGPTAYWEAVVLDGTPGPRGYTGAQGPAGDGGAGELLKMDAMLNLGIYFPKQTSATATTTTSTSTSTTLPPLYFV